MVYEDNAEISSEQFQRPYQYLIQLSDHPASLDTYSYLESKKIDMQQFFGTVLRWVTYECMQWLVINAIILFRHFADCGVRDPSWMELRHFLYFLNAQLEDCESSIFCKARYIKDALPGFKKFVVEFMLKMAKVCKNSVCIVNTLWEMHVIVVVILLSVSMEVWHNRVCEETNRARAKAKGYISLDILPQKKIFVHKIDSISSLIWIDRMM